MTDNIWRERYWERNNAGENDFAWHRLGKRGTPGEKVTVIEAMRGADVDYGVVTVPLFYKSPTDGSTVLSDHVAIIRPEWKGEEEHLYGVATQAYTPLQNHELANLLEPLAETWPIETVGAIRKGADIFLTLDAGRASVGGDEIRQFFFVWNSHDGTSALKVRVTPVRVVCQNTCILGDQRATLAMDVRHTREIIAEASLAIDLVAQLRVVQSRSIKALERLTEFKMSAAQVRQVFEKVWPVAEPTGKLRLLEASQDELDDAGKIKFQSMQQALTARRNTMLQRQLAAFESYGVFNDQFSRTAETGWAVYNTITGVECHRKGGSAEQAATSTLVGERATAMERGYNAILEVAGLN